eukprot:1189191-Prorocentrum_minimum.AAC.2
MSSCPLPSCDSSPLQEYAASPHAIEYAPSPHASSVADAPAFGVWIRRHSAGRRPPLVGSLRARRWIEVLLFSLRAVRSRTAARTAHPPSRPPPSSTVSFRSNPVMLATCGDVQRGLQGLQQGNHEKRCDVSMFSRATETRPGRREQAGPWGAPPGEVGAGDEEGV